MKLLLTTHRCDHCGREVVGYWRQDKAPADLGRCGATNVPDGLHDCHGVLRKAA